MKRFGRTGTIGLAVIVALVLGVCVEQSTYVALLDHYRHTDDPRVIVVAVMTGVGDTMLSRLLDEDETSVTLIVRAWASPGPKVALAVPHLVTVTLASPLGARSIFDPGGTRPPRPRHAVRQVVCPSTWDVRCQWSQ